MIDIDYGIWCYFLLTLVDTNTKKKFYNENESTRQGHEYTGIAGKRN
jgi:hypothetical protein